MKVKIKALDTFHDTRIHVGGMGGAVHRGQIATASEHTAKELAEAGLVEILGDAVDDAADQDDGAGKEKAITTPENKMMNTKKINNKDKKG